jgi:A/G-specific adenine glycosylase
VNTCRPMPLESPSKTHPVTRRILRWYAVHQRDLPWRKTSDPYAVWVSEIMLQQTQVKIVLPYYRRFLNRFPTIQSLAAATPEEVLKVWENLGYYARVRHLHAAAGQIVALRQGVVPDTEEELLLLPGIGPYTAAAIASIAYGKRVPAVDGNVRRVLCRVLALNRPLDQGRTQSRIIALAEKLVPKKNPGRFNQALMDLGAMVCTPRKPSCGTCPLEGLCLAAMKGLQETLPAKKRRPPLPHKQMIVPLLFDGKGRVLIVQRPSEGLLANLWSFPSAEKRPRETVGQALRRGLKTNGAIRVTPIGEPASIRHAYTHFKITAHVFLCRLRGNPRATRKSGWTWVKPEDLDQLPFSRLDRKIMQAVSLTKGN